MSSLDDIRNERIKKLELLKGRGIDPFPIDVSYDYSLQEVVARFVTLSKRKTPLSLVGRIMRLRRQGGMVFFHIFDGTESLQALMKKDEVSEDLFSLFLSAADAGDFVRVTGSLFTTKRGEKTLLVKDWGMLAKSLRPLPEKWHGLKDKEEQARKRYLDILVSVEARERFLLRSKLISELRAVFDVEGYIEVETPTLQPLYGGGSAEPFTTHHNALGEDLYLRISNELYLKRLLIGGFPKVYEIYKGFRNEGIDAVHYPEFSMVEFYESYSSAARQRKFVEKFLRGLVKKITGKSTVLYNGEKIHFGETFKVMPFFDVLRRYALVSDPERMSREEWVLTAKRFALTVADHDNALRIMDLVFKKVCRPKIVQPTFLIEYPLDYLPLAKEDKSSKKSIPLVDVFQLVVGGVELAKAFSELNDPLEQKKRFVAQEEFKKKGDLEAQPLDADFIEAMEYGMPPAGGVGIGIDRLTMLLTDTPNIKDTILFPTMRGKHT